MITTESVRQIFEQNKIAKVAIIDDAFDPPVANLSAAELQTVFDQLNSGETRRALRRHQFTLSEPADITAEFLTRLKALAANEDDAREAWAVIENHAKGRRASLDVLTSQLRKGLKVTVKPIGAQAARKARKVIVPSDSNVIFLDYQLEGDDGELSATLLERIYEQFKDSKAVPLVILMSSLPLNEAQIQAFQGRTKLLGGMFYFVHKDELFQTEKLHYRLAAFAKSLRTGQTLQRFVQKIEDSVDDVRKSVFDEVRALGIADYAFLKTLRLQEDGQPLGEYLLWVISSHLLKEFVDREEVRKLEAEINNLTFTHLPPTQVRPSPALASLYSSAVMRPVDALPEEAKDPATYLQFGDVFRKPKSNKVWVCITPACDLAFSPTRAVPSDRSILFIPGQLQLLEKQLRPMEQKLPRTEILRIGDETKRVLWDPKRLMQTSWGELQGYLKKLEVKRIGRLNTAFALDIQRGFAAELTRVGMPSPPPVYRPINVKLSCLDQHNNEVELTSADSSAALISGSGQAQRLVLGPAFMDTLIEMLATAEEHANARVAALATRRGPGSKKMREQAKAAAELVTAARRNADVLSNLRGPHDIPAAGDVRELLESLLLICNESAVPADRGGVPLRLELRQAAPPAT